MKINKPVNVFIHSWLFGPLAGGLLVGLDYRKAGKRCWLAIAIIPSLIILGIMFLLIYVLPDFPLPSYVLPAIYGVAYMVLQQQLEKEIKPEGYYSIWSGCGVAVLGLLGIIILMMLFFLPSIIELMSYAASGQLLPSEVLNLFLLGS